MDKIGTSGSRWTPSEIEQVRNGIVPAGRTLPAARAYANQHGFKFTSASRRDGKTSNWSRWTPEEVMQVRQGIVPAGRTLSSTRAYAFNHDIRFSPVDSRRKVWSEAEDNMLRAGQVPEGRTIAACRVRAYDTLGIKFSPPKPRVPRWAADGRAEAMWVLRAHGFSYVQLSKFFGVSRERVRQIADRYAKWSGKGRGESAPG